MRATHRSRILLFIALLASPMKTVLADTWKLPTSLDDSNTSVSFEVDSTWHLIHGTTKALEGRAELSDSADPLSISVDLRIPVKLLSTESESRDERLQEAMASDRFPTVRFTSRQLSRSCAPETLDQTKHCEGTLFGTLTMRDVSKNVNLPVIVEKTAESYVIRGSMPIEWAQYNIEDPSILIAQLDPIVTISYQTRVPIKR